MCVCVCVCVYVSRITVRHSFACDACTHTFALITPQARRARLELELAMLQQQQQLQYQEKQKVRTRENCARELCARIVRKHSERCTY